MTCSKKPILCPYFLLWHDWGGDWAPQAGPSLAMPMVAADAKKAGIRNTDLHDWADVHELILLCIVLYQDLPFQTSTSENIERHCINITTTSNLSCHILTFITINSLGLRFGKGDT